MGRARYANGAISETEEESNRIIHGRTVDPIRSFRLTPSGRFSLVVEVVDFGRFADGEALSSFAGLVSSVLTAEA